MLDGLLDGREGEENSEVGARGGRGRADDEEDEEGGTEADMGIGFEAGRAACC